MSKGIITNIIVFDEYGNVIKSDKISNIRNEFINILNKYLPYKQVYFETSNNGSNNLPGITLKLDQLKENEKAEPIIPHEFNLFDKQSNTKNIYQNIVNLNKDSENKSFNIQQIKNNNMNLPFMQSNQLNNKMITTNLEQINLPLFNNKYMINSEMDCIPRNGTQSMGGMPSMSDITYVTPSPMNGMPDITLPSMGGMPSMSDMSYVTPSPMNGMPSMSGMSNVTLPPMNGMPSMSGMSNVTPSPMSGMPNVTPSSMGGIRDMNLSKSNNINTDLIQPIKIIPVEMPNEIIPLPVDITQLTSKPIDYQQIQSEQVENKNNNFISEQLSNKKNISNRGIVDRKPKLGKNICK
jgi:hypothetical protein